MHGMLQCFGLPQFTHLAEYYGIGILPHMFYLPNNDGNFSNFHYHAS